MIPSRHDRAAKATSLQISLSAEEHRILAQRLQRADLEIRHAFHLIRARYPTTARVRFAAANAVADIKTLRMSLAGVVNAELPSAGVDYLSDRDTQIGEHS